MENNYNVILEYVADMCWQVRLKEDLPLDAKIAWYVYQEGNKKPIYKKAYSKEVTFSYVFPKKGRYGFKYFILSGDKQKATGYTDWFLVEPENNEGGSNKEQKLNNDGKDWLEQYDSILDAMPESNGTRYFARLPYRIGIICDRFFMIPSARQLSLFILPRTTGRKRWKKK